MCEWKYEVHNIVAVVDGMLNSSLTDIQKQITVLYTKINVNIVSSH